MPFLFRLLRARRKGLRAADAERELDCSRRLREETRDAVRPLAEIHGRNMFSNMIRDALSIGYGEGRK